jgi:hypothetical protein
MNTHSRLLLLLLALAPSLALSQPTPPEPENKSLSLPWFSTGQSTLTDPRAAGAEAASKAKAALGSSSAKLIVVFTAKPQYGTAVVDGVSSAFDKALIYGGEAPSPITQDGNFADQGPDPKSGVAVLAIGGDCQVTVATAPVAKSTNRGERFKVHYDSGRSVGNQLKSVYATSNSGKLVITFGSQHAGPNEGFAEGMIDALGAKLKMVGGATGGDNSKQIVAGELVDSTNIAILITGNFKVATASSRDEPLKATGDVLKSVTAGAAKPAVVFFFQDHLRRNALIKGGTISQESKLLADASAGAPLFGIDDSGEIGHDAPTAVPVGGAMRTLAAAIIPQ